MNASDASTKAPEERPKFEGINGNGYGNNDTENPRVQFNIVAESKTASTPKEMLNSAHNSEEDVSSVNSVTRARRKSNTLVMSLIVFLGAATSCAFLSIGIKAAINDEKDVFFRQSDDLVSRIQRSWEDYVTAASYIHGRCRGRNFTRSDFRDTYEYLTGSGLKFQAAQFDPNVTHDERPYYEEEARLFYAENYKYINYTGFMGFNHENMSTPEPRDDADFYFPIHYMEPIPRNEPAIDLDYHASGSRKQTVLFAIDNGLPALTDRLTLVQETTKSAFGVVLFHPGYELSTNNDIWPRDLASIVIRIPDLLERAAEDVEIKASVYIYDASDSSGINRFLGAAEIIPGQSDLKYLQEKEHDDLLDEIEESHSLHKDYPVEAANKRWIIITQATPGAYKPNLIFVILGGVIIFLAGVCLAYWVHANSARMDTFNRMRSQAEADRAALILDNARQATKAERELNDFIAHEVSFFERNRILTENDSHNISHFPLLP